jgi:hypothetical protein
MCRKSESGLLLAYVSPRFKDGEMIRVFIRHKVKNYPKWRAAFDAFKKTRRAGGEKSFKIGNVAGQPNNLCLLFTWESVDKAKAFLRSKELKVAMEEAGVREKPEVHIFEDKA